MLEVSILRQLTTRVTKAFWKGEIECATTEQVLRIQLRTGNRIFWIAQTFEMAASDLIFPSPRYYFQWKSLLEYFIYDYSSANLKTKGKEKRKEKSWIEGFIKNFSKFFKFY